MAPWNEEEAEPSQAIPQPGASWQPEGHPARQPQAYERGGTATLLTLFRPTAGLLRAKGVVWVTNAVVHPWLKAQFCELLAELEKKQPAESCHRKPSVRARPRGKRGWATHDAAPSRHSAASSCQIMWPGIDPTTWCAGSLHRASCRSPRQWVAPGSP